MTAGWRKAALTTHVTASVGWLGSVAAFLALAIVGLGSGDAEIVRAAYVAMHLVTWYVIIPFCGASLLTGVIESRDAVGPVPALLGGHQAGPDRTGNGDPARPYAAHRSRRDRCDDICNK